MIGLRFSHYVWYYEQNYRNPWDLLHSIPVVNLNLNRTCPVCTGLPDNSVYWPVPMVQYVALTRLTYYRGQFSWHSPVRGLTMTTPMERLDFYSTRPNPKPIWPTPATGLVHHGLDYIAQQILEFKIYFAVFLIFDYSVCLKLFRAANVFGQKFMMP